MGIISVLSTHWLIFQLFSFDGWNSFNIYNHFFFFFGRREEAVEVWLDEGESYMIIRHNFFSSLTSGNSSSTLFRHFYYLFYLFLLCISLFFFVGSIVTLIFQPLNYSENYYSKYTSSLLINYFFDT